MALLNDPETGTMTELGEGISGRVIPEEEFELTVDNLISSYSDFTRNAPYLAPHFIDFFTDILKAEKNPKKLQEFKARIAQLNK